MIYIILTYLSSILSWNFHFIPEHIESRTTNDTCGHEVGDRLIQGFASVLRSQTRGEDILCRYGGDEFVVILKHMGRSEDALRKGEKICSIFRESMEGIDWKPSCSAGIALCGADERPSTGLIERADQAVYRAKRDKKGDCCLWDGSAKDETAE